MLGGESPKLQRGHTSLCTLRQQGVLWEDNPPKVGSTGGPAHPFVPTGKEPAGHGGHPGELGQVRAASVGTPCVLCPSPRCQSSCGGSGVVPGLEGVGLAFISPIDSAEAPGTAIFQHGFEREASAAREQGRGNTATRFPHCRLETHHHITKSVAPLCGHQEPSRAAEGRRGFLGTAENQAVCRRDRPQGHLPCGNVDRCVSG